MNQLPEVVPAYSRQRGLVACLLCWAGVALGSANAAAQMESLPARQQQGKPAAESPPPPVFTQEREAAALTFVRKNRPELLAMLEGLKLRRPAEGEQEATEPQYLLFQLFTYMCNGSQAVDKTATVKIVDEILRGPGALLRQMPVRLPGEAGEAPL